MKKLFLLIPTLLLTVALNAAAKPAITIDGDKSDWAEVPMLSEPGTWPMLKVLPAADAELGTNALVYMMENTADFDPTWEQYPKAFIDKDYDGTTHTIDSYWAFDAMGLEYSATTGVTVGEDWVSFPKAISADNKVFELGFPTTYVTDLDSKFSFAMYYNSGAWFCPDRSEPAVQAFSPKNGFMYKTRSFTTVAGTTTLTTANVFAHPSMGEIGEYVDFGLRDNGYDTIRWAAFPIELTAPAVYDVTTNVTTTNGWKFEFWLVDVETNAVVAHIDPPASDLSSSATSHNFGAWDLTAIPSGKYMLKVKNRTAFSKVKLNSILLEYKGGAPVAIPGTLSFDDVILSDEAWIDKSGEVDSLLFTARGSEGHNSVNYAKWKVQVTQAGAYDFTANVYRPDGSQRYEIKVLNLDESSELISNSLTGMPTGNASISSGCVYLEEGVYTVKIRNTYDYAKSRLLSVVATCIGGAVQAIPGTADADDAWFSSKGTRDDGMITFSSYTDQWVKWNVATTSTKSYNVTLNINNPTEYGHRFTVAIYENEEEEPVASFTESSWNKAYGTPLAINMGSALLQSGKNYVVKVTNAESGAQPKIISVGFVPAGGGLIDIPGNLSFDEVILSPRAWIDDSGTVDSLLFTARGSEGYNNQEWAKWRINVTTTGYYKFTANVSSSNEQYYKISVLNSDESITIGEKDGTGTSIGSGDKTFATDAIELPVGEYVVKIANTYNHSKGRLLSMAASYEGGAVVEIPANPIPLTDAIITVGATRNGSGLGFNGSVSEYAQWNIEAAAGVYNFTLTVTGSNYSIYKLDVLDGGDNIFTYSQGQSGAGTVTINNVFIPAAGNYVLQLANVNSSADGVITSISAALDDVLILDENATDAAYISAVNGVKKKIILNRTFKGGMYNTICLPFSDWVSSLELVFGTGYELLELNNAELDGDVLNLNFTAVTGEFGHGRPYLIKPTHDVTNPTWTTSDGRTIDASTSYNIKSSTAADFIGSFIAGEVPAGEDNLFLGPNNLLYFSQTATPIKGTRAYFRVKVPNPAQAISRARIVTGGKVATEINLVNESAKFDRAAKLIRDGQLIIIRDGVQYNVMGVKIN